MSCRSRSDICQYAGLWAPLSPGPVLCEGFLGLEYLLGPADAVRMAELDGLRLDCPLQGISQNPQPVPKIALDQGGWLREG